MEYQILEWSHPIERRNLLEYFRHMMKRRLLEPRAYMVELPIVIKGNPTISEMFEAFKNDGVPFGFLVLQRYKPDN